MKTRIIGKVIQVEGKGRPHYERTTQQFSNR